jgi:predicted GIY-YIG superfamily endonuclease
LDKYYVGQTCDLVKRMVDHNSGISKFTSKANDWIIRWSKLFVSRNEALQFESLIKKKKSRKFLVYLIQSNPV